MLALSTQNAHSRIRIDAALASGRHGRLAGELEAFVVTVLTGGPSPCTLAEARAALVVALAADRSRAERRPVPIEEVASAQAVTG